MPAVTTVTVASASVKTTDIDYVSISQTWNYSKRKLHKRAKLGTVIIHCSYPAALHSVLGQILNLRCSMCAVSTKLTVIQTWCTVAFEKLGINFSFLCLQLKEWKRKNWLKRTNNLIGHLHQEVTWSMLPLNNELEYCWCQKLTEHIKIILHPKFERKRI